MFVPPWLLWLGYAIIALMLFYGAMFFINRKFAYAITGHTESGAPDVVGARFFFMAVLGLGFLLMGEYRAMTFLLYVGAVVAVFDAILEKRHGGAIWPHAVAAIGAAVLGFLFHTIPLAPVGAS
jgi:hypothetical protein